MQRNIILTQLIEAKKSLLKELSNPGEVSQFSEPQKEIKRIDEIIANYDDEEALLEVLDSAKRSNSIFKNFYKTVDYGLNASLRGLSGDDEDEDMFYLKVMDNNGMLDQIIAEDDMDNIEGMGELGRGWFKKLRSKIKKGVSKFKKRFPIIAKIGRAIKKYSPATFGIRRTLEVFFRANA